MKIFFPIVVPPFAIIITILLEFLTGCALIICKDIDDCALVVLVMNTSYAFVNYLFKHSFYSEPLCTSRIAVVIGIFGKQLLFNLCSVECQLHLRSCCNYGFYIRMVRR